MTKFLFLTKALRLKILAATKLRYTDTFFNLWARSIIDCPGGNP